MKLPRFIGQERAAGTVSAAALMLGVSHVSDKGPTKFVGR
jgi:hypothetical protein